MSSNQTPNLRVRRTTTRTEATPTSDFARETGRRSFVRPVAASVVVGLLGVGVAGGVVAASAAHSTQQSASSQVINTEAPDISQAAPVNRQLSAEQAAAQAKVDPQRNVSEVGGLNGFGTRGTTTSRNTVRTQINLVIASNVNGNRTDALEDTSRTVVVNQATSSQAERERLMNADIAKVKKEAARLAEEKRKAMELMRQQAQLAKNGKADGSSDKVPTFDFSNLPTSGRGSLPLKPGTFSLGAYFGKYGVWARYHTGQDFGASCGTPIYAAADGVVGSPTSGGWAGINAVIHHANGGSTLYAHMSRRVASPGQMVKAGQLVGFVGSTGRSFGCHLHFEYYPKGTTPGDVYSAANPMSFLRALGVGV